MDTNQAPGTDDLNKVADNPSGLFLLQLVFGCCRLNLDLSLILVLRLWISISNLSLLVSLLCTPTKTMIRDCLVAIFQSDYSIRFSLIWKKESN